MFYPCSDRYERIAAFFCRWKSPCGKPRTLVLVKGENSEPAPHERILVNGMSVCRGSRVNENVKGVNTEMPAEKLDFLNGRTIFYVEHMPVSLGGWGGTAETYAMGSCANWELPCACSAAAAKPSMLLASNHSRYARETCFTPCTNPATRESVVCSFG